MMLWTTPVSLCASQTQFDIGAAHASRAVAGQPYHHYTLGRRHHYASGRASNASELTLFSAITKYPGICFAGVQSADEASVLRRPKR